MKDGKLKRVFLMGILIGLFVLACDDEDSPTIDDVQLHQSLTTGTWRVTYFFDEKDETTDFDGFVFVFNDNGTAIATKNSTPAYGSWSIEKSSDGTVKLILYFGSVVPLDELDEDWKVLENLSTKITMDNVSNSGTGDIENLTLEKN